MALNFVILVKIYDRTTLDLKKDVLHRFFVFHNPYS